MIDTQKMVRNAEEIRKQAAHLLQRAEVLHTDFSRIITTLKAKNGGIIHLAN